MCRKKQGIWANWWRHKEKRKKDWMRPETQPNNNRRLRFNLTTTGLRHRLTTRGLASPGMQPNSHACKLQQPHTASTDSQLSLSPPILLTPSLPHSLTHSLPPAAAMRLPRPSLLLRPARRLLCSSSASAARRPAVAVAMSGECVSA